MYTNDVGGTVVHTARSMASCPTGDVLVNVSPVGHRQDACSVNCAAAEPTTPNDGNVAVPLDCIDTDSVPMDCTKSSTTTAAAVTVQVTAAVAAESPDGTFPVNEMPRNVAFMAPMDNAGVGETGDNTPAGSVLDGSADISVPLAGAVDHATCMGSTRTRIPAAASNQTFWLVYEHCAVMV